MDQNYNNSQNEFLWTLLANPADDAQQYNYNLQRLVNDFPQSGILQALLAHTSDEKNLRQASVYFNAKALYKLINAPASLTGVPDEKIIVQNGSRPLGYNGYGHDTNTRNAENYFSAPTDVETLTAADELPSTEYETAHQVVDEDHTAHVTEAIHIQPVEEQAENLVVEEQSPQVHHQADENPVAETPADLTGEHETAPSEELTPANSEDGHETGANDIIHGLPVAEPIINYAAGMGHRLPPEPVEDGELPSAPHADADLSTWEVQLPPMPVNEHIEAEMHAPPLCEEHLVVDPSAPEEHTPPPIPEEHWSVDAAAPEANTAPPIPEEHWTVDAATPEAPTPPQISEEHFEADVAPEAHTPPPISEEHWEADVAPEVHTPPAIPEEHIADPVAAEYNGFEEPHIEEHPHEEHLPGENQYDAAHNATEQAIEEPIQQYRPWEEPAEEHRQSEVKEEHPTQEEYHQPEAKEEYPAQEEHRQPEIKAEAADNTIDDEVYDEITGMEPDIIGNIAGTDYFMFDRAFGEHKNPEPVKEPAIAAEPVNELAGDAEQQDVSKYHDEKMPYSFLWWLDKTRKEHSGVYQPYTTPEGATTSRAKLKAGTDELQQQYYENIFHITSVDELDKSLPQPPYAAPPAFEHKKKEQVIIERFIQEEPQIRPQSSDKLDNENKAKKSSEDRDELVSETLAAIYSDQMLYHKAIASYKKLMLRFPEKSRYFAAKIEQLEKKTN